MSAQPAGEKSCAMAAAPSQHPSSLLLVGSKLRRQMAGRLQEHVSAPASDFAIKQLEKMGWTAGTGLGKKGNGIVSHIKVKKRAENAGLGTERQAAERQHAAESWWKDSLGDALAKLGAAAGGNKKNGKKKRKRNFTDEELFEATGGARFGTKGGKLRSAKWRRTESSSSSDNKKSLLDENKADLPPNDDAVDDGKQTAVAADNLLKEETLNEGPSGEDGETLPSLGDKKCVKQEQESKKDKKKKKKSKKDKEKSKKKKSKRNE